MSMADRHGEPWLQFLRRLGIEPRTVSDDGCLCLCPFHGDVATPSLSVRDDGLHGCFSPACSARGRSFVGLAMRSGMRRDDALALVRTYGLPEEPDGAGRRMAPGADAPTFVPTGRYHVDWAAMWRAWCRAEPPPDPGAAEAAAWLFGVRHVSPMALQALSVGVDRERAEVVFPQLVPDGDGRRRCMGVSVRSIVGKTYITRFKADGHLWAPPADDRPMVLVEGQLDALRVRSADPTVGTCAYGARLSAEQIRLARNHPFGVVLFLDDDVAGVAATGAALAGIGPHRCRVVTEYHGRKDAGDMTDSEILAAIGGAVDGEGHAVGAGRRHRMRLLQGGAA